MLLRILILLSFLLALPASSEVGRWELCQGPDSSEGNNRVRQDECMQLSFDSSSLIGDTQDFRIDASYGLISFETDVGGTLVGAATLDIQMCVNGYDSSDLVCTTVLASPFNGVGGEAGAQSRAVRITKGYFRFVLVTVPAGAEVAIFQMEGAR